jgi:hypothetical protein
LLGIVCARLPLLYRCGGLATSASITWRNGAGRCWFSLRWRSVGWFYEQAQAYLAPHHRALLRSSVLSIFMFVDIVCLSVFFSCVFSVSILDARSGTMYINVSLFNSSAGRVWLWTLSIRSIHSVLVVTYRSARSLFVDSMVLLVSVRLVASWRGIFSG